MSATLLPFQATLNGLLKSDPQVFASVQSLSGQAIAVCVRPLTRPVYAELSETGITLHWQPHLTPSLTLSIAPNALLRLRRGEKIAALIMSGDIRFDGDMALGQTLQTLMTQFNLDWEEPLSQWLGDAPTHFIASRIKKGARFLAHIRHKLAADTGIYLQEEKPCLPTPFAVETWMQAIDTLRADSDRLDARIKQLEKRTRL